MVTACRANLKFRCYCRKRRRKLAAAVDLILVLLKKEEVEHHRATDLLRKLSDAYH